MHRQFILRVSGWVSYSGNISNNKSNNSNNNNYSNNDVNNNNNNNNYDTNISSKLNNITYLMSIEAVLASQHHSLSHPQRLIKNYSTNFGNAHTYSSTTTTSRTMQCSTMPLIRCTSHMISIAASYSVVLRGEVVATKVLCRTCWCKRFPSHSLTVDLTRRDEGPNGNGPDSIGVHTSVISTR